MNKIKIKKIFTFFTKTRRRKILFSILAILIVLTSIRLIFFNKEAEAAWWQGSSGGSSWLKRQKVPVVNNSGDSLATNTTIAITINTKNLVNLGKLQSDCDDLRVLYQPNESTATELDRVISYPGGGSCSTSEASKVYFKLQAALSSGSTSSDYYIYYGNDKATTPSNPDNAFDIGSANAMLVCSFDGTTTCAASETAATATGAIRYSGSKTALSFDGASDYTTSADSASLSVTGTLTIEAWVKPQKTGSEQTIIGKWDETTANDDRSYRLYITSGNKFAFSVSSNGTAAGVTTITGSTTTVAVNTWYHVAGVYNPTGTTLDLYVNGTSDNTQVTSGPASIDNNASLLYLGAKENTSGSADTFFTGIIDEVRVSEVTRYATTFTTSTSPFARDEHTQALFHFDESGDDPRQTGSTIDDTTYANHATITSAKYASGLVGVDGSSSTSPQFQGKDDGGNTYAGHEGIFLEEGTTNKITNPSFEHATFDTGWSSPADSTTPTQVVDTDAPETLEYPNERKTWHDGSRYWAAVKNNGDIEFYYSTNGSSWTQNTNATISEGGTINDPAVFADSSNAYIVYRAFNSDSYDVYVRKASSYPGTGFSWGLSTIMFGTGTANNYYGPNITRDSNNKLWIITTRDTGTVMDTYAVQSSNADVETSWGTAVKIGSGAQYSYLNSILPLNSGAVYAIFSEGGGFKGCYYDADNSPSARWETSSGSDCTDDAANDDISSSAFGLLYSATVDTTDYDIHYIQADAEFVYYYRWDNGTGGNGTWQSSIEVYDSGGLTINYDPSMSIDLTTRNLYAFWYGDEATDHLYYSKCTVGANSLCDTGEWDSVTSISDATGIDFTNTSSSFSGTSRVFVLWADNNAGLVKWVSILSPTITDTENTTAPFYKFGSKSTQLVASSGTANYAISIDPNSTATHTLSAYVYNGTSGSIGGTVDSTVANLITEGTTQTTTYTDTGGGWWRLSYTDTSVTDAANNWGIAVQNGKTIYLDGVQLEALAYSTTFADGSLGTGYAWTGTANNSTSTRTVTNTQYATSSNLNANPGSISFWAKPQEGITSVSGDQYLFDMRQAAVNRIAVFMDASEDDVAIDTNDTQTASTGITMAADAWQHFVLTYDFTADQYKLYKNGNATPIISTTTSLTAPTLATNFFLGSDYNNANNFNCTISDFRTFDAVLTTAEVADIYYAGLVSHSDTYEVDAFSSTKGQDPVGIWHFDESYGTTANDSSQYDNDLTISGATWETQSVGARANLVRNLKFDGTNDYATRSWDRDFSVGTDPFSISGWFRHPSTVSGTDTILARYGSAGYKIYMNSNGYLCFGIDDDSTWGPDDEACSSANQGSYADSKWHNFEAVRDTNSLILYIDGSPVFTLSSLTASGSLNSNSGIFVGADSNSSNYWDGFLDEIVIYPYARSAAQVKNDLLGSQTAQLFGSQSMDFLTQGLVGYWKMNEDSWTNNCSTDSALDSSGNNFNGDSCPDTSGPTATTVGKFGKAGNFDGTDDYLSISDNDTLSFLNTNFTISLWAKIGALQHNSLVNKGQGTTRTGYQILAESDGTFKIVYSDTADGSDEYFSFGSYTTGQWYHIVMVADKTNHLVRAFVNGNLENTYDITGKSDDITTTYAMQIGRNGSFYANAVIDEVRAYNRALQPAEVSALYNWAPGPVVYYKLDEGTGTSSVNDLSGNGNTGTMTGTMTANDWIPGKFGSALDFDGSDDAITVTTANDSYVDFNGSEAFSGSAWVYVKTMPGSSNQDAIITKYDETSTLRGYRLVVENDDADATGNFQVEIYDESADQTITATGANDTVVENTWYHVGFTFNGGVAGAADDLKLYTNGVFTGSNTQNALFLGLEDIAVDFSIGDYDTTDAVANNTAFTGIIDDAKIYNYIRTSGQIIEDMNADHPAPGSPIGSPVAWYKLDEGYQSTAYNSGSGGSALNGSKSANASWTNSGIFGKAMTFDGTQAVVSKTDDNSLDLRTDSFTASAWIKVATPSGNPDVIINKGATTSTDYGYWWEVNSSNHLGIYISNGSSYIVNNVTGSANVSNNSWHHVVFVWDPADGVYMYVDGRLDKYKAQTTSTDINGSGTFYIGGYGAMAGYTLNGQVDDVRIFRSALTADQIKILYSQGSAAVWGATSTDSSDNATWSSQNEYCPPGQGSTCTAPVGEWKLDENTGTTSTYDTSGNDKTGTLTNIESGDWIPGKKGGALNLDGSNEYIDIGTGPTSVKSVEFWVYPKTTTEYFVNLTSTTDYLWSNAGTLTATGLTSPAYYVNGVRTTTIVANQWQHVVVTTDTAENASNLDIGRTADANYLEGYIDQVRLYSNALTQSQVSWLYNRGAPLAWYKFDECTGTAANNSAPAASGGDAGYDGIIVIGATGDNTAAGTCAGISTDAWYNGATGKRNASLDFDGSNDYVSIDDDRVFTFSNDTDADYPFSLSAWIKFADDDSGEIISKNDLTNNEFRFRLDADDKLILYFDGAPGGDISATSVNAISESTWHLVTATYNGSSSNTGIKLYVDGVSIPVTRSTSGTYSYLPNTTSAVYIGARGTTPSNPLNAQIDEVKIFNYELTPQQIRDVYNQGALFYGPATGSP